jgi:hypothetical protein
MRVLGLMAVALGGLLGSTIAAAVAAPAPDAPMNAAFLLNDCISPARSAQHAMCLVVVGSIMDGIEIAAIAAQKQNKPPSICLPPEIDRQFVIDRFVFAMGSGKGAYDSEKAAIVLGALLMGSFPCK